MAIATLDGYIAAAKQRLQIVKTVGATTVAAQWHTLFDRTGSPGAGSLSIGNTANGLVPTDATTGCPLINAFGGSATGYLGKIDFGSTVASRLRLYDRLFHAGSFAYTPGTTNLASQPSFSSRVPGGTDYTGCELWAEINAAWTAATASNLTVTYTNQSGVAGRTTGAFNLTTAVIAGRMFQLPLQAGDTGVQKIESVTLANGTGTPAAGSVNVLVIRPLWTGRVRTANDGDTHGIDRTGLPVLFADSAIAAMVAADSTSSGIPELEFEVVNG